MQEHLDKTKSKKLPIVYPLIYYTGNAKCAAPKSVFDLFSEKEKKLAEEVFLQPHRVIDVNDIPDERLRNYVLFGLMCQVFKSRRFQRAEDFADVILKQLIKIDENGDIEYIKTVIQYIFKTKDIKEKDKLINILVENLSETTGESIMNIEQQIRQEGIKQGMQQGKQEGWHDAMIFLAKNLLKEGQTIEKVSELTKLPTEEIKNLV